MRTRYGREPESAGEYETPRHPETVDGSRMRLKPSDAACLSASSGVSGAGAFAPPPERGEGAAPDGGIVNGRSFLKHAKQ